MPLDAQWDHRAVGLGSKGPDGNWRVPQMPRGQPAPEMSVGSDKILQRPPVTLAKSAQSTFREIRIFKLRFGIGPGWATIGRSIQTRARWPSRGSVALSLQSSDSVKGCGITSPMAHDVPTADAGAASQILSMPNGHREPVSGLAWVRD